MFQNSITMKKILFSTIILTSLIITTDAQDNPNGFRMSANVSTIFGPPKAYVPVDQFNGAYAGPDTEKTTIDLSSQAALGGGATVGYDFHRNFGMLLSYQYLGRHIITGNDCHISVLGGKLVTNSWSLIGEGRIPVVDKLDFTARLGLSLISNKLSVYQRELWEGSAIISDNDRHIIKENHWGINYGLGILYHLNENMDIEGGFEATSHFKQRHIQNMYTVRFYVGASYKF